MKASMVLALVAVLISLAPAQTSSSAADLDQKVRAYLEAQKSQTRAGHFSDSDGKLLYDMILKNNYLDGLGAEQNGRQADHDRDR